MGLIRTLTGSRKRAVITGAAAAIIVLALIIYLSVGPSGPYEGKVFASGHGGHVAVAEVAIDPTAAQPIQIKPYKFWSGQKLRMISMGDTDHFGSHDFQLDAVDRSVGWSSNYFADDSMLRYIKLDVENEKYVTHVEYELPEVVHEYGFTTTDTLICDAAQTRDYVVYMMMGYPSFLDVIDKNTMEKKHRVMLYDQPEIPQEYTWVHGANTPDFKELILAMNHMPDDAPEPYGFAHATGDLHLVKLDMQTLVNEGRLEVIDSNFIEFPKGTGAFRSHVTDDGEALFIGHRTRATVVNVDDLSLRQQLEVPEGYEIHDLMPTPDGKYGLGSVRIHVPGQFGAYKDEWVMDGALLLYDVENNQWLGDHTSMCYGCHDYRDKKTLLPALLSIPGCNRCHLDERSRWRSGAAGDLTT